MKVIVMLHYKCSMLLCYRTILPIIAKLLIRHFNVCTYHMSFVRF